jgi:hypothetical protein
MGSFFIWRWGNGILVPTEREWNRMSEWKMAGKRNFVEGELVLLECDLLLSRWVGPTRLIVLGLAEKKRTGEEAVYGGI